MSDVATKFGCIVRAVVTGNVVVYGCSSHLLNLLGDDLSPQPATAQGVEVNKYFCNHQWAFALLDEYKSQSALKPQLVSTIRWNSQIQCMNTDCSFSWSSPSMKNLSTILDSTMKLKIFIKICHWWLRLLEEECLQPHKTKIQKHLRRSPLITTRCTVFIQNTGMRDSNLIKLSKLMPCSSQRILIVVFRQRQSHF